ncbi:pyruvate kinase [Peptoniphilus catoniae]|uniref:pyruvate kinase n=1 Tax=Peptoniphilus catoniae TaxID=1660341 RepID=UPI0010FCF9E2|nr:pyruvate kinase [Peptoniphilus catoniae]
MKRTKIVATIGPASDSEEMLELLLKEGVDVCRLNFSHGTRQEHLERIKKIKKLRDKLNLPVALMLDTKGPEIRLGTFRDMKEFYLESGDKYILTTREIEGEEGISSVSYKNLPEDLNEGSRILIDDGLISMIVNKVEGSEIYCTVENGGMISSRKGLNLPGVKVNLPAITEKDIEDIEFGIENDIDFIAASFVRSRQDVLNIRKILEDRGNYDIRIIAKVESKQGLDNLDEILEVSDGIMVARGDLGVEIMTEEVPLAQKLMIKKCNLAGKPVITATQMLDSMMRNPRPTRAEANDVANAVLDGSSAVMLSGETASGKYPLLAVKTMRKIIEVTERSIDFKELLKKKIDQNSDTIVNAIGKSACTIAGDLNAKAIITATTSGSTTRAIAKFMPKADIIAVTVNEKIRRQLNLEWGTVAITGEPLTNTDDVLENSVKRSIEEGLIGPGDTLVLTAGVPVGLSGSTNLIKVQTVSEIIGRGVGFGLSNVTGSALVVNSIDDLIYKFKAGDILILNNTDKEIMEYVKKASAIVAEVEGYTSHAAITGLSLNLPTVVGVKNARKLIKTGDIVSLNPLEGLVKKGMS